MRFDAHLHVWWPGDGAAVRIRAAIPALDRDHSFASQRPALAAAKIDRVVLVSAAQQADDNARLSLVARANPDLVAGIVGWIDAEAADVAARVRDLAADPLWKGARFPLTIHPDRHFVRRPEVGRALRALRDHGAIAEFLAGPDQLLDVADATREVPGLVAVLDHAGLPDFAAPPTSAWCHGLAAIASLPAFVCKVSNFWSPGDPPVREDGAFAFYREIVAAFGPRRMIAGANWPPSGLAEPYGGVWDRLDRLAALAGLDAGAARAIAYDNADRLFSPRRR
ncbi:MAG: amidohydrolase family protein [Tagaea sp.]|nr:amidohydrolase family protein [Tagaea sp.]